MSRRLDNQQAFEQFLFNPPWSVRLVRRSVGLAAGALWVTADAVGALIGATGR